jgi:p-aminobenzoyl-glutamate transporter AbgT
MGWLEVVILVCVANGNRYLVTVAAMVAVVECLAHGDDGIIVIVPFAAITQACIEWQLQ